MIIQKQIHTYQKIHITLTMLLVLRERSCSMKGAEQKILLLINTGIISKPLGGRKLHVKTYGNTRVALNFNLIIKKL